MNIDQLIKKAPSNYLVYCDLRNAPLVGKYLGGNQWIDLRFFSFTLDGYNKYFTDEVDELRETVNGSPENYL